MQASVAVDCHNALGLDGYMMKSSESWTLYPLHTALFWGSKSCLSFFMRRVEHSMMPKSLYKQKVGGNTMSEMFPQS